VFRGSRFKVWGSGVQRFRDYLFYGRHFPQPRDWAFRLKPSFSIPEFPNSLIPKIRNPVLSELVLITMKQIRYILFLIAVCSPFFSPGPATAARTLTDETGRSLTVPADPNRIVSFAPSITEIIFALGKEDRLKGVSRFSDFPPEATRLPSVGSYIRLDLEKIVALRPDLCFATKDGNPKDVVTRLASLNIPVYVVDPKNLEAVMETIARIGEVLNAGPRAMDIVQKMRSRIDHVKTLVATAGRRPRVFFQIGISPIVSVGAHTLINELIEIAGGINVAKGPTPYPRFSREQVLALAPDVLIITSMARGGRFEQVKKEWSRWPSIPAVQNHRILMVDSNLFDRPSPRLADALEILARQIHPDLFKE
jgi:iron complex transport system substrate-binding protein